VRLGTAVLPDASVARDVRASRMQQATGMSFGVDLGRHLGVELAGDVFEANLQRGGRDFGEYGSFSLVPQVRLRYPLEGGVTPYVVGGVGVSINAFNDRKDPAVGLSVHADDTAPVGALGVGVEYHLTDDIALGGELRYLVSRGHEVEVAGRRRNAELDALLATVSLRLLGTGRPDRARTPVVDTTGRYYLMLRVGGAAVTDERLGGPFEARAENAAVGDLSLLIGVTAGIDLGHYLGVELAADGHEPIVRLRGVGAIGEYAVYTVVPQARLRYPLLDGRLVPYALGGVGASYAEYNDRKGVRVHVNGSDVGLAVAVGAGLEHFVTGNIAVGVETKYVMSRGHELEFELDGRRHGVGVDALLATAGVRIYFGALPMAARSGR
jgi:opacity protein-like surface antigen